RRVLLSAGSDPGDMPPPVLGVLTTTLAMSVSSGYGLDVGQLVVFTTLTLLLALWARNRGRPVLAGLFLALARVEPPTLLPFLLLFCRRKDRLSWLALAAGCLGLYLLASPADELFVRLHENLHNIAVLNLPGHMNNYVHPVCFDMISFSRALHYLGV